MVKKKLSKRTKINIYEAVMSIGFVMGGSIMVKFPLLGALYLILGIYSYCKLGELISNGKYVPFWRTFRLW